MDQVNQELAEQISRWGQVGFRFENNGRQQKRKVRVRLPESVAEGDKQYAASNLKLERIWGWLPVDRMGVELDRWLLLLPFNIKVMEVELPSWWDGQAERLINEYKPFEVARKEESRFTGEGFVEGCLGSGRGAINYLAPFGPGRVPDWPNLAAGSSGSALREQMVLLGVVWKEEYLRGNQGEKFRRLLAAWENREGHFLGWQAILSVGEIRAGGEKETITFEALKDWEMMEGMVRTLSWGREL